MILIFQSILVKNEPLNYENPIIISIITKSYYYYY